MSKDLTDALRKLMEGGSKPATDKPQPRGSARRVVAAAQPAGASGGGGGATMTDLTEVSTSTREYWPGGWRTTDGLFEFPAIKKVVFTDADDNPISFNFASPS